MSSIDRERQWIKMALEDILVENLPIRTVVVRDLNELQSHVAAWDQLAWNSPQKIPTLLPSWVDAFLRHKLSSNESWLCCFAYAGDRLVGVLPVIATPHSFLGSARPMLRTPSDAHTPSGDIALAPNAPAGALGALLAEVGRQVPGHLGLDLKAVRRSSLVWNAIGAGVAGYLVRTGLRTRFSFLDVGGDFDEHSAGLGQIRSNLRRWRKKLNARGAVSVELRIGESAAEDFLTEFLTLEASGWKGRNGTAMLNNPTVVAFYETLVRNFATQGRVEWKAIRVDEKLIAAEMCIQCGGALTQPKQAYDEDFADCKPGHLLRAETIKDAFSRPELVEFNPMSEAQAHRLWRMPVDEYVDVHLVRRGALPAIFQLSSVAMRAAYQSHVRPRIPVSVKKAYSRFRLRNAYKP
jgi:CelD/BcsL family acetyltransferase involved in cellulose biosynthesis